MPLLRTFQQCKLSSAFLFLSLLQNVKQKQICKKSTKNKDSLSNNGAVAIKSRLHCIIITSCSSMMVMGNIIITKYRNFDTRNKNISIQNKFIKTFVMLDQCLYQFNMDIQLYSFSLFGNIYCKKGILLSPCPFWIRFCQLIFFQKFPNFFGGLN